LIKIEWQASNYFIYPLHHLAYGFRQRQFFALHIFSKGTRRMYAIKFRSFLCETYSVQKELHRAYIRALYKAHIKKPYVKTYGK